MTPARRREGKAVERLEFPVDLTSHRYSLTQRSPTFLTHGPPVVHGPVVGERWSNACMYAGPVSSAQEFAFGVEEGTHEHSRHGCLEKAIGKSVEW